MSEHCFISPKMNLQHEQTNAVRRADAAGIFVLLLIRLIASHIVFPKYDQSSSF
jgi:hypothetical protein